MAPVRAPRRFNRKDMAALDGGGEYVVSCTPKGERFATEPTIRPLGSRRIIVCRYRTANQRARAERKALHGKSA